MGPDEITKLLARTALRDRNAFDRLYRLTSAKLFGVCLRVLKDRAEAEEALQEIYIKIWHKADRFTANDLSPITWLVAVARTHCIDRLRARKKGNRPLDEAAEIADAAPGPEAQAAARGERRRIDGCLDELEADRALAVRGAYLDGDSYVELAERFSVPLNTMRTWLRRSLMKLKDCLEA
jgi:RNA polymerase sigma-70 factor (ECF subfamily)